VQSQTARDEPQAERYSKLRARRLGGDCFQRWDQPDLDRESGRRGDARPRHERRGKPGRQATEQVPEPSRREVHLAGSQKAGQ